MTMTPLRPPAPSSQSSSMSSSPAPAPARGSASASRAASPPPPPSASASASASASPSPSPSSPSPSPPSVPLAEYTALAARLDREARLRAQLEAELCAARDHAHFLQRRLAQLSAAAAAAGAAPPASPPQPLAPQPSQPQPQAVPSSQPVPPFATAAAAAAAVATPPEQDAPGFPPSRAASPPARVPRAATAAAAPDKEILSHCSDISACKPSSVSHRSPDASAATKASSPASRKSTPPSVAPAVRKPKAKKERPTKVKIPGQSRYWTQDEHKLFLEALNKFGHKDLRSISQHVGTRNMTQVRTHSQKYFMRLMREAKRQNPASQPGETIVTPTEKTPVAVAEVKVGPPRPVVQKPEPVVEPEKVVDEGDKYSVPNTCGMTLLCLVGEDTLPA